MNNTTKRQPSGYWTYETCYNKALKYNSRSEFEKGCSSAYNVARKKGWLDNYTWFIRPKQHNIKWTYETCYNEALKYNSRKEFEKGCSSAYQVARKNNWLDNYTWFISRNELQRINQTKWTYETCYNEALKYNSRKEFEKGCSSAYKVARQNGWLDNYTWFEKKLNPYTNKLDNVYCYIFESLNSVYVGRTININERNKDHNTKTDSSVYKFAQKHNIVIPQITILEINLNPIEGLEKEHFYVTKYKLEGWNVLNKAKTGKNCGSLGGLGHGKWNKKTCYQEALKYNSRSEFEKGCGSAYLVALKKGWLDTYTWFETKQKPSGYWNNYENNKTEAKKYNSRYEFKKGCVSAYKVARQNGWLDTYTWFKEKQKYNYWNKQTCFQEAQKYNSRGEFAKSNGSAYLVALKKGWLDNYTWFIEKKQQKSRRYWEIYENNYKEAKKYNSRKEFYKGCSSAYQVALKNSWIDIFFPKTK